ncbi:arylsulfotransferase family protein [Streptomyces sp. 6N223]|uniref:arylsulfotransferase family protein n=1 Tax=Streptomyces sp. 6N223 TaxID=3457412 RepID=UPI003FD2BE81
MTTTRLRMARRGAAVLGAVVLGVPLAVASASASAPASASATGPHTGVLSRPDIALQAPALTTTATGQEDPGLLLTTPGTGADGSGAAIYDNNGDLVWWREGRYTNLAQVTYQGEPALSVFLNTDLGGEFLLLDSSYSEIASLSLQGGYLTDVHDLQISPDGSRALLMGYDTVPYDLSEYGGPADGQVVDAVIQEQDLTTGEVTFEWHALDHIPLEETHEPLTTGTVDYVHVNSMDYDADGDLLLSGRHTSTVYKVDIDTGGIVWRFGGENSDFTFPGAADRPSYQHDARRLSDGRLSVFDNGNRHEPPHSRGAVYEIDEQAMTARLTQDLQPGEQVFGSFLGSNRELANGDQLVSYGNTGRMVEFSGTEPVFEASFPQGTFTYRAERATDWAATPAAPPDVAVGEAAGGDGSREVAMSWNGATEVESWRIEAGPSAGELDVLETVDRTGFETRAEVDAPDGAEVYRVSALDADGRVLGSADEIHR